MTHREIKFRFWDKENKKMYLNSVGVYPNDCKTPFSISSDGLIVHPQNETLVLMQFTGLKDKNGKEIYEGDIIRILYVDELKDKKHIGAVEWDNEEWGWVIANYDFRYRYAHSDEVIGNIYENPELLKGRSKCKKKDYGGN